MKTTKSAVLLILLLALQACGGGGSSGGSGSGTGPTGSAPGSFTVSAATASFAARQGGALPASQVLHVHLLDNSAAVLGAAYVAPQTQPSWLNIAISGSAPDYDVTLSITTTALAPVTLSTTFTLGTADSTGKILYTQTVQTTLAILQSVGVSQKAISDSFILGSPATAVASSVGITADPTITWSLATSAPWIQASVTKGTGSTGATITVDASSLPAGNATGTITVTDAADATDTATISVNADVVLPTLTVSPASITLGGTDGLSQTPQPLQFVLDTGASTYPWSATLATNTGGNWLTIDSASGNVGTAGATANVNANYSLVSGGSYTGTVQVQVTVKGQLITQTVPVTFNKEQDWIYVPAEGVAFSQFPSRSVLTRTLQVTSSEGRTDIPWSAQSDQSWLAVTSSGMTGGSMTLTANPAGLTPDQEYIANVTISSSDGSIGNTEHVRVGLWIGSADPGGVDITASGALYGVAANPVEPEVYVTDGSSHVLVYNVYTGALLRTLATSLARTSLITVSSDGTTLFVSDATNLEVVSIDPATGAAIQHYPWGGGTYLPDLAYARPSGHPILLLGNGSIYNLSSGQKYQASFGQGAYQLNFNLAVDGPAHYLYTQERGLSPSTLTQYTLKYTALTADGLIVAQGPSTSGGSNGEGLCASFDGSRVYTANGAPYEFPAFSASNLEQSQVLPAAPYPIAAVCAWNGLFVGGADTYGDPVDTWVYESDGAPLTTLNMDPAAYHNLGALVLSGDDTRLIGITGVPSLDIHSIPAP